MKTVLVSFAILLAAGVALLLVLAGNVSRDIARTEARLAGYPPGKLRTDLPPAILAFAERGMAGGRPGVAARFTQAAEIRQKRGGSWAAAPARQTSALPVPGFAWITTMKIGPLPAVRVVDQFEDGTGSLEIRAFGAIRLDAATGPDAALGEGLRYLAELPWTPDAILVNDAIVWAETSEGVTARIETVGGPAEVMFTFDGNGDIVAARADDRPAKLDDGTFAPLVWRGRFKDYAEIGGRRIPLHGEVGYDYPDGYETYFRGRITSYEVIGE